ncbi:hypothetical protein QJS04_geneDACA014842 [Acorus gramineus]|uniref:Uncharacterized protein n=1 Tax=Acorus gramineus TaxID=55184 RepID=A0AAV9A344_ACOGR|nr:hypothetical protein QJS04_geneDACA014842 [Acorus gramineus]
MSFGVSRWMSSKEKYSRLLLALGDGDGEALYRRCEGYTAYTLLSHRSPSIFKLEAFEVVKIAGQPKKYKIKKIHIINFSQKYCALQFG